MILPALIFYIFFLRILLSSFEHFTRFAISLPLYLLNSISYRIKKNII